MKQLFYDIETSPNIVTSWGIGKTYLSYENILQERAVICISWKWGGEDKVRSLTWDRDQGDYAMISKFMKVLNEADEIIAHNGDNYDIRFLAGRAMYHDLDPFPWWKTVDTYKLAKRRFRLNCFRLDYLGEYLGLGRKNKTEYSWWLDILIRNDRKRLREMVDYCEQDVVLLEKVYDRIAKYSKPTTHAGALMGLSKWTCAHCASENVHASKRMVTASGYVKQQMQCNDCNRYFTISESAYKQYQER